MQIFQEKKMLRHAEGGKMGLLFLLLPYYYVLINVVRLNCLSFISFYVITFAF